LGFPFLQRGHALTPISAQGELDPCCSQSELSGKASAADVSTDMHGKGRDLQQNMGKSMRYCVWFQIFSLIINSGAQGEAVTGKEEVGKGWPQVSSQNDPAMLRESWGKRSSLQCTDSIIACQRSERDIC